MVVLYKEEDKGMPEDNVVDDIMVEISVRATDGDSDREENVVVVAVEAGEVRVLRWHRDVVGNGPPDNAGVKLVGVGIMGDAVVYEKLEIIDKITIKVLKDLDVCWHRDILPDGCEVEQPGSTYMTMGPTPEHSDWIHLMNVRLRRWILYDWVSSVCGSLADKRCCPISWAMATGVVARNGNW